MVKTQIQLPDELYSRVKQLAKEKEMPMAEVFRRGAEYMLEVYPLELKKKKKWELPKPVNMGGDFLVSHEQWRELANEYPWPPENP